MRNYAFLLAIVAVAVTLMLVDMGSGTKAMAADGVVLFAPGVYEHQSPTAFHANAAKQIHGRLLKSGVLEGRIAWIQGRQATVAAFSDALTNMANSTESNDLLLVVICSPGVRYEDHDYVFTADTPTDPRQGIDATKPRLLAIAQVLREMGASVSKRRVLIVDGAAEGDSSVGPAFVQFGCASVEPSEGQWVIINRANVMGQRAEQSPMTDFMWSFADGIAFHADGNRDGFISVLELVDYMKLYAEEQRNTTPSFAGKTTGDAAFLPTSAANDDTFPREALLANARRLVAEARKALLLELDLTGSQALLTRAGRLCVDVDLKAEIDDLTVTASILGGKTNVVPLVASEGITYSVVLPREAGLYSPGATQASRRLPAGTVVQISHRSPSSSEGDAWPFLRVVGASRPQWTAGQISFHPVAVPSEPLWMLGSELVATADQAVPSVSLRQEFLKPDTEQPSPTASANEESSD